VYIAIPTSVPLFSVTAAIDVRPCISSSFSYSTLGIFVIYFSSSNLFKGGSFITSDYLSSVKDIVVD